MRWLGRYWLGCFVSCCSASYDAKEDLVDLLPPVASGPCSPSHSILSNQEEQEQCHHAQAVIIFLCVPVYARRAIIEGSQYISFPALTRPLLLQNAAATFRTYINNTWVTLYIIPFSCFKPPDVRVDLGAPHILQRFYTGCGVAVIPSVVAAAAAACCCCSFSCSTSFGVCC